jgi:hypothetical protein
MKILKLKIQWYGQLLITDRNTIPSRASRRSMLSNYSNIKDMVGEKPNVGIHKHRACVHGKT